ncbi:BRCA1 BRCA2-containing complex, subunit 3 [Nucella lapillus]
MPVSCVNLESDAYLVCLTHALSTEREEVMGLLIGEVDENSVVHISAVIVLRRSDKQPDRVEISPEQLSDASTKAERLAQDLNRPMRVIGWYHSHPHITVWPSHVDVRTQAMYQMMDDNFVGLIFSVFNEDKQTKHSRIQVTCFQAVPSGGYNGAEHERYEVPLKITPSSAIGWECLEALVALPGILQQEEEEAYANASTSVPPDDLITRIHNSAVYTKSLCHVMEVLSGPIMTTLENRLEINRSRCQHLQQQKQLLEQQLAKFT